MKSRNAFTLMEMLAVIAVIAILAAWLLPVLNKNKQQGQGTYCQNNLRQMQIGWLSYAADNADILPHNSAGVGAGESPQNPGWVAGNMWLNCDVGQDFTESTNTDLLVGSQYTRFGSIGGYVKNPAVYHCPADKSVILISGQAYARVRSLSMNNYTGALEPAGFRTFLKLHDITAPGPSDVFVFIDEREDSINDGLFAMDPGDTYGIRDYPADYHNRGANLSFADGHAEYHQWVEPTTMPPIVPFQRLPGGVKLTFPTDRDMKWLVAHTTSQD